MEVVEDVVIVGAGIAGLTSSLGLHRLGIRSVVLESSDTLGTTGFALAIWTNAWRALDAIGVGDRLRQQHDSLLGGDHEIRCVRRKLLLEALASELPSGTIRFSSKVVSIEESGYYKLVHLADGTILKAKTPQLKQYMLTKLGKLPDEVRAVRENTVLDAFISSPLRYRHPWEILWGNISKGNVCVAGDALHPMTPDIGQGGCAALEDGIVLARCLGEALLKNWREEIREEGEEGKEEFKRIEIGLNKYASERKWRSFDLISTAYVVGVIQEADGKVMTFLRDKVYSSILSGLLLKKADFDCGKLRSS